MASRPPNQHVSNPSPKTTNIATKSKNAALQQAAEKAAVHTKEALEFIEVKGDLATNLNNEKEHKRRPSTVVSLTRLSGCSRSAIRMNKEEASISHPSKCLAASSLALSFHL